MGENWKHFDAADFTSWKKKQGSAYKSPPRANFLVAANHIRNVLEGKKINWAVMGGLAMMCLGSSRDMPDIHIVYDDREFSRIKMKLESDRRIRMQKGMNPLFPSKLLVSTGPKYKDVSCTENVDVEVDLVPPGSHGSPPNDVLRNSQVMLRLNQDGQAINFRGLNMLYLVKTSLHFCKTSEVVWDARKDLVFLCRNYGKEIGAVRGQLNVREVQEKFLGTGLFSRLSPEDQRLCYNVLLGKDPPPSMSLTPAPPQGRRGASSSQPQPLARPQIPSHKSTPALNTAMDRQSNFLTPPLPGKSKSRPAGPANPPTSQNVAPPQHQRAPQPSSAKRDIRSRYRTPNSAPNTPSASRDVSPEIGANARPKSMDMRETQKPGANPSYRAHIVGVQNVAHVAQVVKPQVVHNAPSPTSGQPKGIRPQKSLPAMAVGQPSGNIPVFAHGETAPAMPRDPPQGSPPAGLLPAFGSTPPHKRRDSPQEVSQFIPNQSIPRQPVRNSHHPSQMHSSHNAYPHPLHTTSKQAPPLGDQSGPAPAKGLRVVGAEGQYTPPLPPRPEELCAPPLPPRTHANNGQLTATIGPKNTQFTAATSFVFELDAGTPQATTAPSNPIYTTFIAELPAEADGAGLMKDQAHHLAHMAVSPPLSSSHAAPHKRYEDSPVSPPAEKHQQPPQLQIQIQPQAQPQLQPQPDALPPKLPTQPDPSAPLPSSLTIGGPGKRRSPSNSVSNTPPTQQQPHLHPQASLAPEVKKYMPNPNRISMYRAYSAPAVPLKEPVTAPAPSQQPSPPNANGNSNLHTAPPTHHGPDLTHSQAPVHPIFMQSPPPSQPLSAHASSPAHVAALSNNPTPFHRASPPQLHNPPLSKPQQQQAPTHAPPPDILRAGPAVQPLQKNPIPRHLLPNPLGANPPTPPPAIALTEQDSHQGHQERVVVVGAGVVGGAAYATYTHQQHQQQNNQLPPQNNPHLHPQQNNQQHQIQHQHYHNASLRSHATQSHSQPQASQRAIETYEQPQFQPGEFMPSHQRNISSDTHASTSSHDSVKLAMEYQLDLPSYGQGYGKFGGGHGHGRVDVDRYVVKDRDADAETVYDFT
ncbi:hypothetical protein CC80DRAFT_528745 [Byssothecium circinans]|uniref:Uncharacterized protein n=1 Tax=Byssothecium circinans TaxID=147558 RepID=A0A6A5TDQ3_9PLEO|nr:hypothetical protein CC80DRAFT_599330 [Byssothecium circinans]KAF1950853.1 hypothetical protein CC80DRAFT_528745 [Byssothecium circinans]